MIVFPFFWLLVGLLVHVSLAEEVTTTTTSAPASTGAVDVLAIWDLDKSCDDEAESMKAAMEDSLGMATAAYDALKLLGSRPDPNKDPEGYLKFTKRAKTVYKTCHAMLGFEPTSDSPYLAQVLGFFENMKTKMSATNDFEHGYVGQLKKHGIKPKIMCGETIGADQWAWKPITDLEDHYEFRRHIMKDGAWVYDHRYFFQESKRRGPDICTRGKHAEAFLAHDLIVFCDRVFGRDYKSGKWPRDLKKSGIYESQWLNYHRDTLPVTVFHELTHWFGGWVKITDPSQLQHADILDQSALNQDGNTIWDVDGVRKEPEIEYNWSDAYNKGWHRHMAYGLSHVINLAECRDKTNKRYCGPKKAIKNAESLTFFALAMYLDKWDWSHGGKARIPGKKYEKKRPRPPA